MLSIKIIESGKFERIVTFFPAPMTFPVNIGSASHCSVTVAGIPDLHLEYAPGYDELFLIPSESVYRIQGAVKNKIAAGTKLVLHDKDVVELHVA